MKTAQDYFDTGLGTFNAGFNRKIQGFTYNEAFQYPHEKQDRALNSGWITAEKMIEEGKLFYVHNFHSTHSDCKVNAFQYGGFWVCNKCGQKDVDKPWWIIKVIQDGDAWCCVGESFINLQESDNFAFGKTREEAIQKYGDLFYPATN